MYIDSRDPELLGLSILYAKSMFQCSVVRAADRIEAERLHQRARPATRASGPGGENCPLPCEEASQADKLP